MQKWLKVILVPLGFLVFIGALILLNNQLKDLSYTDIINSLRAIPALKIVIALGLALSYYLLLGGYDIVAFKYINAKAPLKPKDILFTCFISNVLGSNTGYSMLFGGSIRYRLYSIYNISMVDVTKVLLFSSATIWLGLLTVGGLVFTIAPVSLSEVSNFNFSTRWLGIIFLAILATYILLSLIHSKPKKIFKWTISFPNIKIVAAQVGLATADWLIASLTLFTLMPSGEIPYFVLLKVFLVAQLLGIISQVPGGMGVFEASIALLLPHAVDNPGVIGALLAYRAIFYFFPLSLALSMLGSFEIMRVLKKFDKTSRLFGKTVSSVIVQVLAVSTFFAGMIAIFATSTPFNLSQIKTVINMLPPWFVDLSHFLLSITAAGLLFLSRTLQLRIKNAYKWTCLLLAFAIVFILIVGEPPAVLAAFIIIFVALLFSKKYFYREISVINTAFNPWWFTAIAGVFAVSVWIGFFVNKQDILSWIHLDVFFENLLNTSDTARFLRATLGIFVIFIVVASEQIFRNFFKKPVVATKEDIKNIVDSADYTYALNALAFDKKFIANEEKNAFIMYAPSGNNWIALGDPVGKSKQAAELLWKFKETTDREAAKPAFVGIDHKHIQIYDDIGLDVFEIGKEGKIALRNFDKDGELFKNFKQIAEEVEKEGFEYDIIRPDEFEKYRKTFAEINEKWKEESRYIKRSFIPGKYNESYMKDMNFSILKKEGKVCAFSVFQATKNRHEISTGVVRYTGCSKDVFAYMLFKNIIWSKENDYKWFDLGLAYVPSSNNDGDVIKYFAKMFMFAEHFNYDLVKLKEFKDKFSPVWHKKYVAIHPDRYIGMFIRNFTSLISSKKEKNKRLFFKRFFIR